MPETDEVSEKFLYTIEQVELLRRLRNTGITSDQIVRGIQDLEMIEIELNMRRTQTPSPSLMQQHTQQPQQCTNECAQLAFKALANAYFLNSLSSIANLAQHSKPSLVNGSGEVIDLSKEATINPRPSSNSVAPPFENGSIFNAKLSVESSVDYDKHTEDESDDEDLKEFLTKGEKNCSELIRRFVHSYNLKQYNVSQMTGISQSYISRFLKGETYDMSEKTKINLYKWYLSYRKHFAYSYDPTPSTNTSSEKRPQDFDSSLHVTPYKRERFTFKSLHLEVLEQFFTEDPYPDGAKREVIAEACNSAIIGQGRELLPRERVTTHVVANWFANRRKESRRQQKIKTEQCLNNESTESVDKSMKFLSRGTDSNKPDVIKQEIELVNNSILSIVGQHEKEDFKKNISNLLETTSS